ncbi:MAG TPA: hypothetical protein VMV94_19795 [Phycisphaerae bacterium]|nr:hypothetical protein [Phycisphaerae bacterium]
MADQAGPGTIGEQHDPARGASRPQADREKRRRLVEMEYGLQAIELHMASVVRELEWLEGFTLTSLLARVRGNRESRIREIHQQMEHLQSKIQEATAAIDALRQEVEQSEQLLAGHEGGNRPLEATASAERRGTAQAGGSAALKTQHGCTPDQADERQIAAIRRALGACEEARKGLLMQVEAAGSLDQCNVAAVNTIVSGMLGAATDHARKGMAQQVRSDIHRLLRCWAEADKGNRSSASTEELNVRPALEEIANNLDGAWFMPGWLYNEPIDELHQTLSLASMLLEKRLNDATRQQSND